MPNIVEIVDDYIGKKRTVVEKIMSIQSTIATVDDVAEYKKLLLASHIDGLSGIIFPNTGSRERYVRFVLEFSKWSDAERISLIHLAELARRVARPEFQELRKDAERRMSLFTRSPMDLSHDPYLSEIQGLWPQGKEFKKPLAGVTIEALQHASLFYSYRCALAHELLPPGFQWDALRKDDPYYIETSNKVGNEWKQQYELVYPLPLFQRVAVQCLDSMAEYLKSNNQNPYASYTAGEFWLESLNK